MRSSILEPHPHTAGSVNTIDHGYPPMEPIEPLESMSEPIDPPTIKTSESRMPGTTAEDYFNDLATTPSDETPTTTQAVLERRRMPHHLHSLGTSSRRTRSRSSGWGLGLGLVILGPFLAEDVAGGVAPVLGPVMLHEVLLLVLWVEDCAIER